MRTTAPAAAQIDPDSTGEASSEVTLSIITSGDVDRDIDIPFHLLLHRSLPFGKLSLVDHSQAADLYMVLGALLGTQNGREVEIVNTFELAVEDGREIMAFSYKDGINVRNLFLGHSRPHIMCSLREVGVGAIGQYWTFLDLANTVALMVNPSPYYRVKRSDRRNVLSYTMGVSDESDSRRSSLLTKPCCAALSMPTSPRLRFCPHSHVKKISTTPPLTKSPGLVLPLGATRRVFSAPGGYTVIIGNFPVPLAWGDDSRGVSVTVGIDTQCPDSNISFTVGIDVLLSSKNYLVSYVGWAKWGTLAKSPPKFDVGTGDFMRASVTSAEWAVTALADYSTNLSANAMPVPKFITVTFVNAMAKTARGPP
ncbi:hypothetical protein L210DRAFT_3629229 [Boletus edulis BED1]|uniref:Uncharacterized protein n=1 Tax=Boletus edulis BED1 TaxID=1328754 RepID=A0AAD4BYW1_BOLED|nr:hypothetical protein L210DRAFT_3629229 [Boletus edulis BED1]